MKGKLCLTAILSFALSLLHAQLPGLKSIRYHTSSAANNNGRLVIYDCKPTSDGGFILAGIDSTGDPYNFDFNINFKRTSGTAMLAKTDSAGNISW